MFARVSTFKLRDGAIDTMRNLVLAQVEPKLQAIDGLITTITTYNDATNEGQSLAVYQDAKAAEAAQQTIAEVWSTVAEYLQSPPSVESREVVLHVASA